MEDSEYYVQIFLFVATILCYIVLAIFAFCGIYYCCLRLCILRTKRRRQHTNDNDADAEQQEPKTKQTYFSRRVELLHPFHKDDKKVIIVPNSNTSKITSTSEKNVEIVEDNNTSDFVISNTLDERNPFIDKKYYDIFVA